MTFFLTETIQNLIDRNDAAWVYDEIIGITKFLPVLLRRPTTCFLMLQRDDVHDLPIHYYDAQENKFFSFAMTVSFAIIVSDPETRTILYTKCFSYDYPKFNLTAWSIFVKNGYMMSLGEWQYGDSEKGNPYSRFGVVETPKAIREEGVLGPRA